MKKTLLSLALVTLSYAAFSQVTFNSTNGENIKMKASNATKAQQNSTRVYFDINDIPDSLENIGIMTVNEKHRGIAIEKAKIYGARATGVAVLLDEINDKTTADKVAGSMLGNNKKFRGHYIFYVYRVKQKSN